MARPKLVLVLLCAALAGPLASARAATLQQIGTYESPVYVTSEPTDPSRLYVVEQPGTVQLTTAQGTATFLDITDRVLAGGEQGLLSIAFAPDFASTGLFYVYYNDLNGDLQIDEYRASGDVADPGTRRALLTVGHPNESNHNGGQLQFGPDGYLYAATGDGGGGGDPGENAQDLAELLGKVIRIDPSPGGPQPYSIPPSNPFAGSADGARDEIWAYGLRNPWRFSFDRLTAALSIGDVGQAQWEEINYAPAPDAGRALNFGWDCREGRHDFELAGCPPTTALTDPILEYSNPPLDPASVTGGYVVRDLSVSELYGRYVYADVYSGEVRSLVPGIPDAADDRSEGMTLSLPVSFGEDATCGVYVVSLSGPVYRIANDTAPRCPEEAIPPGGSKAQTDLTLKAKRKRVVRGNRARLRAIATPCPGRAADQVELRRRGKRIRAKPLNDRCRARFRVRLRRPARFRAVIEADESHLGDRSNRIKVRIRRE